MKLGFIFIILFLFIFSGSRSFSATGFYCYSYEIDDCIKKQFSNKKSNSNINSDLRFKDIVDERGISYPLSSFKNSHNKYKITNIEKNQSRLSFLIENAKGKTNKKQKQRTLRDKISKKNDNKDIKLYAYYDIFYRVSIPVLKSPILPGDVISEHDIMFKDFDINKVASSVIRKKQDLVSMQANKRISPMQMINNSSVSSPKLINKNDIITIMYSSPSFQVKTNGKALKDGYRGEVISVENLSSKKKVQAMVVKNGIAEVNFK